MYWLVRPPIERWIIAALILSAGLFWDLRPQPMVAYPYAGTSLAPGQDIATAIEWREIPGGILPDWDADLGGVSIGRIAAGSPLLPDLVSDLALPEGWWTVPLRVTAPVAPGTPIRVLIGDEVAEGFAVGETSDSGYELVSMVAFAAADADQVAAASADDALVVMIGAASQGPGNDG